MRLFLCSGAMKTGTTWLHKILRNHPDLYFPPEKEIHFLNHHYKGSHILDDTFRMETAKRMIGGKYANHVDHCQRLCRWYANYLKKPATFEWYRELFSPNRDHRYNCDFCNLTSHLKEEHWADLKTKVEHLRVIYIMRDPLRRYWSHIKFHHEQLGFPADFATWTVSQFRDLLARPEIEYNGRYTGKIKTMQNSLSDTEFKLLCFEEMISQPESQLKSLETFLGIRNGEYDRDGLVTPENTSTKAPMPKNFLQVCLPMVAQEVKALEKVNIQIPESWGTAGLT